MYKTPCHGHGHILMTWWRANWSLHYPSATLLHILLWMKYTHYSTNRPTSVLSRAYGTACSSFRYTYITTTTVDVHLEIIWPTKREKTWEAWELIYLKDGSTTGKKKKKQARERIKECITATATKFSLTNTGSTGTQASSAQLLDIAMMKSDTLGKTFLRDKTKHA